MRVQMPKRKIPEDGEGEEDEKLKKEGPGKGNHLFRKKRHPPWSSRLSLGVKKPNPEDSALDGMERRRAQVRQRARREKEK